MLLIVNLQFSEFLQFSNLAIRPVSTQVGYLLFSGQFEQTKMVDLATCPEFWKCRTTEVPSKKMRQGKNFKNIGQWMLLSSYSNDSIQD